MWFGRCYEVDEMTNESGQNSIEGQMLVDSLENFVWIRSFACPYLDWESRSDEVSCVVPSVQTKVPWIWSRDPVRLPRHEDNGCYSRKVCNKISIANAEYSYVNHTSVNCQRSFCSPTWTTFLVTLSVPQSKTHRVTETIRTEACNWHGDVHL